MAEGRAMKFCMLILICLGYIVYQDLLMKLIFDGDIIERTRVLMMHFSYFLIFIIQSCKKLMK